MQHLIRLQEIDERIRALEESAAALPRRLAAIDEELARRKATVEQTKKDIAAEDARRRRLESDLKDQQQKIVKFREQSSSVKTNDQYHALQKEIAFAEGEIGRIEDEELASMERSDELEAARVAAEARFRDQTAQVDVEKAAAARTTAEGKAELTVLRGKREEHRRHADPAALATYDRVASVRKTGLARVQGQRCLGCQMALRPQMWNQIRAGALLPCESCGRLLYYDPALEPPAPAAPVEEKKPRRKPAETDPNEA